MWTLQNIKSESPIHAFTPLLVLIRKNFKFIMVKPQVICEGNWPHPTLLCIRCYIEDTKLVEIMIVICKSFNFVKDNQCFNGFSFVKRKLKNQLTMHPDVVIQMITLYIYIYIYIIFLRIFLMMSSHWIMEGCSNLLCNNYFLNVILW
jgi:hypothetical protein